MRLKKSISLIMALCILLAMSGCAVYDKEYLAVNDYVVQQPDSAKDEERTVVSNLNELKSFVEELVEDGRTAGNIVFSEEYSGDVNQDMNDVCWQVKTTNALCAYCVENISYEVIKIVSYYEATVNVIYADTGVPFEDIKQIQYSTELPSLIEEALAAGNKKLVIFVRSSGYNADSVSSLVTSIYRKNPIIAPKEPSANVQIYSGTGFQMLYNITFNYGMNSDKLVLEKEELSYIMPFSTNSESDYEKFAEVAKYLADNCSVGEDDSIYGVLVDGEGNDKAFSLAFVALCKEIGLQSQVVEGQMYYSDRFWNIVRIDDSYFHFDPYMFVQSGPKVFWLRNDTEMWNEYRWDTSSYPKCNANLPID